MNRSADWLKEAKAEMQAARALCELGHHAWACFTCHQAAEKALKAALERTGAARFGHNLNDLTKTLGAAAPVPQNIRDAVARLNRHYIPTRYPDAFPTGVPAEQYTAADAAQAIEDADAVIQLVDRAQ